MDISNWRHFSGYITGSGHVKDGASCQDRTYILSTEKIVVIALADGAGSRKLSQYGAETVTKSICEYICKFFNEIITSKNVEQTKADIVNCLCDELEITARKYETDIDQLRSTLLFVAISENMAIVGHLGDGLICYITADGNTHVASSPTNGEYKNMTFFVDRKNAPIMRLIKLDISAITGFVIMSDGSADSVYIKANNWVSPLIGKTMLRLATKEQKDGDDFCVGLLENVLSKRTQDDCSIAVLVKTLTLDIINNMNLQNKKRIFATSNKKSIEKYFEILNLLKDRKLSTDELERYTHVRKTVVIKRMKKLGQLGFITHKNGLYFSLI